jgi:hypothetical protein
MLIGVVFVFLAMTVSTCGPAEITTEPSPSKPPPVETQNTAEIPATATPEWVDPESDDWDGDGLANDREMNTTLTDPNDMDTDKDRLKDGQEVLQYKTSALLADTDGDGLSDYDEIKNGGTSPLLADMPQLSIELFGSPSIDVHYEIGQMKKTETIELVENKEKKEDTESVKTNMSIENNVKLHTEAEVGTSQWPPSASAKLTTDTTFSQGYFQNTSSNWEQSSLENIQKKHEQLTTEKVEYSVGKLSVALKITNLSAMSINLENLIVNVYQPDKTLIGNIKPNPETWRAGGGLLKPGGSFTITLENDQIPAQKVQAMLENPTALIFEVASYGMFMVSDANDMSQKTTNFDILAQNVIKQTGMISINYGDGTLERHLVASNVERNFDGSAKGIPLAKALSEMIGLQYQTCEQKDADGPTGITVLCKIEDRETFDYRNDGNDNTNGYGFWTIGGTGPQFGLGGPKNFNDILLKPKQSVYLVYFKDSDGDRIFDSDEYLLGTDKARADTDGDRLSDYDEARAGWVITLTDRNKPSYSSYSDPLLANTDGDGWNDNVEFEYKTDPQLADTDGDNLDDDQDDMPLGSCLTNPKRLGLAAWWQPAFDEVNNKYLAKNIWKTDLTLPGGDLEGYDPMKAGQGLVFSEGNIAYFSLNRGLNSNEQYITMKSNEVLDLSGKTAFTIAADVIWDGTMASGQDTATLLAKGSTFGLYINKDGAITFKVFTRMHEKCWGKITGWDDTCSDRGSYNTVQTQTTAGNTIVKNKKHHILATFNEGVMLIYVDGEKKLDYQTYGGWSDALYKYKSRFENLITDKDSLLIGNTLEGELPFKGRITNIQLFNAHMLPDNIEYLYRYGLCTPSP